MNDYEWISFYADRVVADHDIASKILNVDVGILSQHVERGNISCVSKNPGRGKSRQYTFKQMLSAALTLELAKYDLRYSEQNRKAVKEMTKLVLSAKEISDWILKTHSGTVDRRLLGKSVYFQITVDDNGDLQPLVPSSGEVIKIGTVGNSAIIIVVTAILSQLLGYLRPLTELSRREEDKAKDISEFVSRIKPRRR